jgi:hypothetical protein
LSSLADLITEVAPGCIRTPFVILVDKAEKRPFDFRGITARSFIDAEQREYIPRTERAYLGIGMGDYSLAGFQGRVAIERKSLEDFQGTLLGWPRDATEAESAAEWDARHQVNRRARFKRELAKLARMQTAAVVVEANLVDCLRLAPCWGKRSSAENAKYLFATYAAWANQFRVPWHFCDGPEMAAVVAFRILEKFWDQHRKEVTK